MILFLAPCVRQLLSQPRDFCVPDLKWLTAELCDCLFFSPTVKHGGQKYLQGDNKMRIDKIGTSEQDCKSKTKRKRKAKRKLASAANRTRGPSNLLLECFLQKMATMDFTTKPLMLTKPLMIGNFLVNVSQDSGHIMWVFLALGSGRPFPKKARLSGV